MENVSKPPSENRIPASSLEIQILLREHEFLSKLWEMTNERTNEALRAYLTIAGITGTGIAIVSQLTPSLLSFLIMLEVAAVVLFIGGTLLQLSIVGGYISRSEYVERLNKIRQYFLDESKNLSTYLSFFPSNFRSGSAYIEQYVLKTQPRVFLLKTMTSWNSTLFAVSLGIPIIYLIVTFHAQLWVAGVTIGLIWTACYKIINQTVRNQISSHKKWSSNGNVYNSEKFKVG